MLGKLDALKAQILDRLKVRIQSLGRDPSIFELLLTGGQCNQAFRRDYFEKYISGPAEHLFGSLCVQDFQASFHLKCVSLIESHRCTAHTHCPLRLGVWYLLAEVDTIYENYRGICLHEFQFGECSRCLLMANIFMSSFGVESQIHTLENNYM